VSRVRMSALPTQSPGVFFVFFRGIGMFWHSDGVWRRVHFVLLGGRYFACAWGGGAVSVSIVCSVEHSYVNG